MIYKSESVYYKIPHKYDRSSERIVQKFLNPCSQDESQELGVYFIVSSMLQ